MRYLLKNMLPDGAWLSAVHRNTVSGFLDRLDFHPHYELYFCPEAVDQRIMVNGREYGEHRPCVILFPPYSLHHISAREGRESFDRYVAYYHTGFAEQFSEALLARAFLYPTVGRLLAISEWQAEELLIWMKRMENRQAEQAEKAAALAAAFSFCAVGSGLGRQVIPFSASVQ